MDVKPRYIGKLRHRLSDVSSEYQQLAFSDEAVGKLLLEEKEYKHSVYFLVQAMEKYVRHKIFSLVNPNAEYFRNRTRTHNLDELLDFLIEIVSSNKVVQNQVKNQLETYVLGGIRFGKLHNNLRYPVYFSKYDSYSVLEISKEDAEIAFEKLQRLKAFLEEINRLKKA